MIESIKDILSDVKLIEVINQERNKLKIEFEESLYLRYNQGLFKADKETLLFIELLIKHPIDKNVLLDINDVPIEIKDLNDLKEKLLEVYHKTINNYLNSYNHLKTLRTKETFFHD